MDGVSFGDLAQLGAAAPFCWLFYMYDKAARVEREAQRLTNERLTRALDRLIIHLTGHALGIDEEERHVQPR
jgi:hypothetical protein